MCAPPDVRPSLGLRLRRRVWDRRAHTYASHGAVALRPVVEAVLRAAEPSGGIVAVDLGCGTGQLSLPLARSGVMVTAIDLSPRMA
ncbi:MAG: class I SAM-dependent methyltransferase, partial [Acidimicrobiales bacterium]